MASGPEITVRIPYVLRDCCAGATEFSVPGSSAQKVLEELERRYPALYRSVCDDTGALRRHVGFFVNNALVRSRQELEAPIGSGDIITIMPAVSGG